MITELKEHHIAEIRDKIDNWPASRLNAKDLRNDCRSLLDHIDWLNQELKEAQQVYLDREKLRRLTDWAEDMPRL